MSTTFSELLNQYLRDADLAASVLARRLRIDPSTVSRWLNDGTRPRSLELVTRIADVLGVHDQRKRVEFFAAAGFVYVEVAPEQHAPDEENEGESKKTGDGWSTSLSEQLWLILSFGGMSLYSLLLIMLFQQRKWRLPNIRARIKML